MGTSVSNEERRSYPRYAVRGVDGTLLLVAKAEVLDMSVGGMAVSTSTSLRIGRRYSFKLSSGHSELQLTGTVVWCRLVRTQKLPSGDTEPIYEAGMRFESVLSEKARELIEFLEESAIITLSTRIAGRFLLEDTSSVDLQTTPPSRASRWSRSRCRCRPARSRPAAGSPRCRRPTAATACGSGSSS